MSDQLDPKDPKAVSFLMEIASKELQIADEYLPEDPHLKEAFDALYEVVVERIEEMIDRDFESLLLMLYRADVNEQRLKNQLDTNPPEQAASIIAGMFIARQLEKFETRKRFSGESKGEASWVDDL